MAPIVYPRYSLWGAWPAFVMLNLPMNKGGMISPGNRKAGIHRRRAFPPPPEQPSMLPWSTMGALDDDVASALFWLSRRVRDVADSPPEGVTRWTHEGVVQAAALRVPEIAPDLLLLALPRIDSEGKLDSAARACQRIARWTADRGSIAVAKAFAGAAVALQPTSARHAYEAGRLLRIWGATDDAELLYGRAVALNRGKRQSWIHVRAHLGLGQIQKARGNPEAAAAHFATAASAASFAGEKWLAGLTEHDLLVLTAENGRTDEAFIHAQRACEWLPKHHSRLPALVHDYCLLLLHFHAFETALHLLELVISKPIPEADQVIGWSTLAKTAASLVNAPKYHTAASNVLVLAERFDLNAAAAFANLATGAYQLGFIGDAEKYARRSIEIARTRTQVEALAVAEPLLHQITTGIPATPPPLAEPPPPKVRDLAARLRERLKAWRGSTWKRKRQSGLERLGKV